MNKSHLLAFTIAAAIAARDHTRRSGGAGTKWRLQCLMSKLA